MALKQFPTKLPQEVIDAIEKAVKKGEYKSKNNTVVSIDKIASSLETLSSKDLIEVHKKIAKILETRQSQLEEKQNEIESELQVIKGGNSA